MGIHSSLSRDHQAQLQAARTSAQARKLFSSLYPRYQPQEPSPPTSTTVPAKKQSPAAVQPQPQPSKTKPKPTASDRNAKRPREVADVDAIEDENQPPAPKRTKQSEPQTNPNQRTRSNRTAKTQATQGPLRPITNASILILKSQQMAAAAKTLMSDSLARRASQVSGQCSPRKSQRIQAAVLMAEATV